MDAALEFGQPAAEIRAHLLQIGPVDSDPGVFHPGQDRDQRELEASEEVDLVAGIELCLQPLGELSYRFDPPSGGIEVGATREVERSLLADRLGPGPASRVPASGIWTRSKRGRIHGSPG